MLSTPCIRSPLRIRKPSRKEVVHAATQGRRWLLGVIVDINDKRIGQEFNPDEVHACLMTAAQVASRWRPLQPLSFPPPEKYKNFQVTQPLECLEYLILHRNCKLGSRLGPFTTAITTTATPRLDYVDLSDPEAILYLHRASCVQIFHSIRYLDIYLSKRMESPADIFSHFRRLEAL